MLEQAYTELVEQADKWDRSVFHYLLNRLAAVDSRRAVDHCLTLLEPRPEETSHILDYLERAGALPDCADQLATFAHGEAAAVYPFQTFVIIQRFILTNTPMPESLLALCRRWAYGGAARYPYLRRVARQAVGKYGTAADLEQLHNLYAQADSSEQKLEIVMSLHRLERQRRNAFLSRVELDGKWNRLAVRFIKSEYPDPSVIDVPVVPEPIEPPF